MKAPSPDPSLLRLTVGLANAIERRVLDAASLSGAGRPTRTQVDLFRHLDDEGTRIKDLAERMQISPQAAGELVRTLAARGWVSVEPSSRDRRVRHVVPTAQAVQVVGRVAAAIDHLERELSDQLGSQDTASARRWMQDALALLTERD